MRLSALGLVTFVTAVLALTPAVRAHAAEVFCGGVKATIVGTSAAEVIHGTTGRDVIAGLGGSDTIRAGDGNDLVCGGGGADRLYGGTGKDTLYGGRDLLHRTDDGTERIGDTLRGGPGHDRLHAGIDRRRADDVVSDVFSWDGSAHGVRIDLRTDTAQGQGADTFDGGTFAVVGSSYGDVVEGSNGGDRIYTGPGPDVVHARGGADVVVVDDTHRGVGGEADRVRGGDGADRLTAGRGEDHLSGGSGNDWLEDLGASNDVLTGGAGNDTLVGEIWRADKPQAFDGGRGFDTLDIYSSAINPRMAASTGSWNMASGAMTLTVGTEIRLSVTDVDRAVFATWGTTWSVTGTSAADFVSGSGSARMSFDGLGGDDTFRGSDGDDVFNGGTGHDHSLGMGDGDDTCTSVETMDVPDCESVG